MPVAAKEVKQKACKSCGQKFKPHMSTQKACSVKCALVLAKKPESQKVAHKAIAQRERKETQARREKLKSKADHIRDTQKVFNEWVRLRDHGKPCISCGTTADVQYAAGHYRTTASCPELRFEPLNVHLQCNRNCNMGKSGNIGAYRIELVKRIGQDKVDWLEGPHDSKRYTVEELKAIRAEYREKIRELRLSL